MDEDDKPSERLTLRDHVSAVDLTDAHAAELGGVLWAANWAQSGLYEIFRALVRELHPEIARAIWHSHRSDSAQRSLLKQVAREILVPTHTVLADILWVADRVDQLSKVRNDFAHTPMVVVKTEDGFRLAPDPSASNPKSQARMDSVSRSEESARAKADLVAMGSYARALTAWLERPNQLSQPALPNRPALQANPRQH